MLCINYKMENNTDILDIKLDNLKLDKKDKNDLTIYYINHINENKKPMDDSNELCLSVKGVSGYIFKENDEKFLLINQNNLESDHYYLLLTRLKNIIASEYGRKGKFIKLNDGYKKTKYLNDDKSIPDELLYFNEIIIDIKCILKEGYILYLEIYLKNVDYELYK